ALANSRPVQMAWSCSARVCCGGETISSCSCLILWPVHDLMKRFHGLKPPPSLPPVAVPERIYPQIIVLLQYQICALFLLMGEAHHPRSWCCSHSSSTPSFQSVLPPVGT